MVFNTKTGVIVAGVISKDPELKFVGNGSAVLKLGVRYGSEPAADGGRRKGRFLDIDVWDDAEKMDGMFAKGDAIIAVGEEIKSREYNGQTYYSLSADIYPSASVVFRWMQQIVDMIPDGPPPMEPLEEMPMPEPQPSAQPYDPDTAPIEDTDDLPF